MGAKRAETASDMPARYLPCRAFRHEPRFLTDRATKGASGKVVEFVRITQCNVCHTRVETTYSIPDFRVKARRYFYPDNYQVKGGLPVFDARVSYIQARFA